MVMFFAPLPGSTPSVLRARRCGVSILRPQTVNPSAWLKTTWKLGEFFRVMRYSVKLSESVGDNEARNLLSAAGARLLGQIPPGVLGAKHFFAAAAVDDAVAHYA